INVKHQRAAERLMNSVIMRLQAAGLAALAASVCWSSLALPAQAQKSTAAATPPAAAFRVEEHEIDDLKSVFATVRSRDRIEARVRTPGTVVSLKVDEGQQVQPGQVLAIVADPKIALRMRALDAQILGL